MYCSNCERYYPLVPTHDTAWTWSGPFGHCYCTIRGAWAEVNPLFDKVVCDVILPWWSGEEDVYLWGALGCCTCRWSMGEVSWLLFKQCASVVMKDLIQMLQGMILHVHVGPLNNTTVAMMEVSKLLYTLVIGGFVTLIFSGCVSTCWCSSGVNFGHWSNPWKELSRLANCCLITIQERNLWNKSVFAFPNVSFDWFEEDLTLYESHFADDILSAYSRTLTDFE